MTLVLPPGSMRRRILDVLDQAEVDVEILEPQDNPVDNLQEAEGDVVILDGEEIDADNLDAVGEAARDDEGTSVAVIGEASPARRANMIAAGISSVLSETQQSGELGRSLEALADAEATGGVSGPEVGGAEAQPRLADFLTRSPRMQEFVALVRRVIDAETSLLLSGPTGVGKERLARAIHAESPRATGPFVNVNCAALPEQLLESELFGHEKGAFTGADRIRQGHFELASGGTIFLDEIGEMPIHLQVKLLTVLQSHEIQRVGAPSPVRVDVRVMAATNRNLQDEVQSGRFREDLFYRLNVVPLHIPALSERPEDVPDLAGRFIQHFREVMPTSEVVGISDAAIEAMMGYGWPGNVRELINVIERAMLLCVSSDISIHDLPPSIVRADSAAGGGAAVSPIAGVDDAIPAEWLELPIKEVRDLAVRRAEATYLRYLLVQSRGQLKQTAAKAGLGSRALYEKMKRYDLRKEDFKDG